MIVYHGRVTALIFDDPLYIIRYSELGLKGPRARNSMEQTLVKNILAGLRKKGQNAVIKRDKGRIYLSSYSRDDIVSFVLERTMGIKTFSLAHTGKISGLQRISPDRGFQDQHLH